MSEFWKPRRVLSIDGGGIRGLSAIMILKGVMEKVNDHRMENDLKPQQPYEYFDMIGGTSTGGIIAIMLGRLHMTLDECEQAYRKLSSKIFTPSRASWNPFGRANDLYHVNGKFDSSKLESAIKSVVKDQLHPDAPNGKNAICDDLMEQDPTCHVFVTSAFRDIGSPVFLRTYRNKNMHDSLSRELKIWQACRATSAATTFFDAFELDDGTAFIDCAIRGWNNPVQQALAEARDMWPEEKDKITVLSIGTGYDRHISLGGNLTSVATSLVKLSTDTERVAQDFYRDHADLVQEKRYIRLNVPELGRVGLEEFKKFSEIRQKTQYYLQENASERLHSCFEVLESSGMTTIPSPLHDPQDRVLQSRLAALPNTNNAILGNLDGVNSQ